MKNSPNDGQGLAVRCDDAGRVVEIIRDDLELCQKVKIGDLITRIFDTSSIVKALNFLLEIRTKKAAFDWELNVKKEESILLMHFAGGLTNDFTIIVAASEKTLQHVLFDEMMMLNNEQINEYRMLAKGSGIQIGVSPEDKILHDEITRLNNELISTQRILSKSNADLQRMNDEKNFFLGMAAHDLRNPLASIMAYAQFMHMDAVKRQDEQAISFMEEILSSSKFMTDLVNNFLDVAAIESGKLKLYYEKVDLVKLISKIVAMNQVLVNDKNIKLVFVYEDINTVKIDSRKIEQVVTNLITNASKFSSLDSEIKIELKKEGNQIIISVKDSGPGISEDDKERIFNAFQRGTPRGNMEQRSTGLGLNIAKRLIEGHGGTLWVESTIGQGSTFFFSLPTS